MPSIRIKDIVVGERVRKDLGSLQELADSIRDRGLLQPIVVDSDNNLVAGFRRVEAAKWFLGWTDIECYVVDPDELLLAERDENTVRKDFTPTEAVAIGRLIEAIEKPAAHLRKVEGARRGGTTPRGEGDRKLPQPSKPVVAIVAEAVGMSPRTYDKAKAVVEAAEEDHDKYGDLAEQMDATGKVQGAHDEMKRRKAGAPKGKVQKKGKKGSIVRGDAPKDAPQYDQGIADAKAWLRKYGHIKLFASIREAILDTEKKLKGEAA